jgi:hypothetical protein
MRRLRVVASLALVSGGVTALIAIQLPGLPPSAGADAPPTQPGSAFASAVVLGVNPQYGGLSLIVRGGQSTASYTGSQAVADSQAVNLGYVGGLLNGPPSACFGGGSSTSSTAALDALQAASASGASSSSADDGVESVSVNPSPESAAATTSLLPVAIPDFLNITSHAATQVNYASGQDQKADATATISIALLGGLISLNGLTWTATQESGSTDESSATFSMNSVTVAGKTTEIDNASQLALAFTAVNKALQSDGIALSPPVESTDSVTGTVGISPLQLQLTGNTITNTVLGQLNPTETTVEQEIGKALAAGNGACLVTIAGYVGDAVLVAGIVEGIMAGGGVVDLQIGGASADTEAAPNYTNPLDASGSALGGSTSGQLVPPFGSGSGSTQGSVDSIGAGTSTAPNTQSGGATNSVAPPQHSTSITAPVALVRCVTSSPSGRPGCWSGAATVAAAILLVAGGTLFATDFVRGRRKLIRPKETI